MSEFGKLKRKLLFQRQKWPAFTGKNTCDRREKWLAIRWQSYQHLTQASVVYKQAYDTRRGGRTLPDTTYRVQLPRLSRISQKRRKTQAVK